jgi:hypothetical protein
MKEPASTTWLLLIHQIPTSPPYLRVKIWRKLQKIGAVAVKGSVYALPRSDESVEDFHWIAREIMESKGDASVCEATFIEGISNDELIGLFRKARESDYEQLVKEAQTADRELKAIQKTGDQAIGVAGRVAKLRQRLTEIQGIDFFSCTAGKQAESAVSSIESKIRNSPIRKGDQRSGDYLGRTWVTRKGIHIDRIASAWLICRFIDNKARFKFVSAKGYRPEPQEFRFDMFDAEFTHEGGLCTFEVLIERMNLRDRALTPIAEMVHDTDLKESKFSRPEAAGFALMINAVCTAHKEDNDRLERGSALLDDLYEFYRKR